MDATKRDAGAEEMSTSKKHRGSCHCGAVKFEVELHLSRGGSHCNCTLCMKTAIFGSVVKPAAFKLLAGEEGTLGTYVWGFKTGRRFFCEACGVHCYGRGHLEELGGDYVSVNLCTLDGVDVATLPSVHWDGRHDNWHAGPRATPWPVQAQT